jgi:hypothetical protein
MLKFEINRMTIELIRAILRFRSSFLLPMSKENNIRILFSYRKAQGIFSIIKGPLKPNFLPNIR